MSLLTTVRMTFAGGDTVEVEMPIPEADRLRRTGMQQAADRYEREKREREERLRRSGFGTGRHEYWDEAFAFDYDKLRRLMDDFARTTNQSFGFQTGGRRSGRGYTTQGTTAPPPRTPAATPGLPRTRAEAITVVRQHGGPDGDLRRALKRAMRTTHPDTGGKATDFHAVTAAEQILRQHGDLTKEQ